MTEFQAKLKPVDQAVRQLQIKTVELVRSDVEASHALVDSLAKAAQPSVKTNAIQESMLAFQAYGQSLVNARTKFFSDSVQAFSKLNG